MGSQGSVSSCKRGREVRARGPRAKVCRAMSGKSWNSELWVRSKQPWGGGTKDRCRDHHESRTQGSWMMSYQKMHRQSTFLKILSYTCNSKQIKNRIRYPIQNTCLPSDLEWRSTSSVFPQSLFPSSYFPSLNTVSVPFHCFQELVRQRKLLLREQWRRNSRGGKRAFSWGRWMLKCFTQINNVWLCPPLVKINPQHTHTKCLY